LQGLPACEAIPGNGWDNKAFEQSMNILAHPTDNIPTMFVDVVSNEDKLMTLAQQSTVAYRNKDYEVFGEAVGDIIKMITTKKQQVMLNSEDKNEARTAITGVMQGFMKATEVGTFNFTNLLICIYEADQDAEMLYVVADIF
jgi:hypothetical protein